MVSYIIIDLMGSTTLISIFSYVHLSGLMTNATEAYYDEMLSVFHLLRLWGSNMLESGEVF